MISCILNQVRELSNGCWWNTRKGENNMPGIAEYESKTVQLLMGNEAIARGALEAGVGVAAAYPGTPSTEIIDTLAGAAKDLNMYVEWSVNEKVALEVAAGASLGGVRAITAVKQLGLNVALDFLANLNLTGIKSGLVLVACDDPGALSSTNEQDSRNIARMLDLPLLEPATQQEAKDMTKWAFDLSEQISNVCIVRSVTRISHARGNVVIGELGRIDKEASFNTSRKPYTTIVDGGAPKYHKELHASLVLIAKKYEGSPFNWYSGPDKPDLLIITCGSGWLYSWEAVNVLALKDKVGILKLGTSYPLPSETVKKYLLKTGRVLVVEEVDAFLETNLKELAIDSLPGMSPAFHGKSSGHIPYYGELNPDIVINALAAICNISYSAREKEYRQRGIDILGKYVPPRAVQFCAGCPHRGLFWALKDALKLDGRDGILTGDIGCYGSAAGTTGYSMLKTMHSMGSGIGMANGLGHLEKFGLKQPVLTTCGDSTFFHAAIPALINGIHNSANFIFLLLDNSCTAMTGFQPHPGIPVNASGEAAPAVDIDCLCRGLGLEVEHVDPYDVMDTVQKLVKVLQNGNGPRVVISKRECALMRAKSNKPLYKVQVSKEKCIGEACGCDRYCSRVFKCPGLVWNASTGKSEIDQAVCVGCGVCTEICSYSAITKEDNR
jgi:indolepyruvate ferredoxin oxidoreductase alpha subunit